MTPQEFSENLPAGPLVQHIRSLHATMVYQGATGPVLASVEHSLRDVSVYTAHQPGVPPGPEMVRLAMVQHFPEWDGSLNHLHRLLDNHVSACGSHMMRPRG